MEFGAYSFVLSVTLWQKINLEPYRDFIFGMHTHNKKKEIWLNPMTETLYQQKIEQHKNATKNFDYTTITERLRTVSWSTNSYPNDVVKPVYGHPTFPLTAKAV